MLNIYIKRKLLAALFLTCSISWTNGVCELYLGRNTSDCATSLAASGAVRENDVISMTCRITYSGNWAPTMKWFNSRTGVNYTEATVVDWTATITSQLTVAASAGLHGSRIVCVSYFTHPSTPLHTSATNIPRYTNRLWTSPTLNVQCKQTSDAMLICH